MATYKTFILTVATEGDVDTTELAQALEDGLEFVRQTKSLSSDRDEGYVLWVAVKPERRGFIAALEERRCEVCGYAEHHREHTGCLRNQVSSLKVELREICAAIDDPAGDLTLTTVECIKKLKAENESLKLDAEQWRAYQKRKQDLLDHGFLRSPLREEAELNPTMTQGEK